MKRYTPGVCYGGLTEPFVKMEPEQDGLYVLASEALADNERLRGLVRNADNDAWSKSILHAGMTVLVEFYDDGEVVVGIAGPGLQTKAITLAPPTPTPNP